MRSKCRNVERLGRNSDNIIHFLAKVFMMHYGVGTDNVFMDWTLMYLETLPNKIVKVGYSHDKNSDRAQVTVGLSMNGVTRMLIDLTVNPGNIIDVMHFDEALWQLFALLLDDTMQVFDNGAYSKDNAKLVDSFCFGFVKRLLLNTSDNDFIQTHD